jgi:hypothetical protein
VINVTFDAGVVFDIGSAEATTPGCQGQTHTVRGDIWYRAALATAVQATKTLIADPPFRRSGTTFTNTVGDVQAETVEFTPHRPGPHFGSFQVVSRDPNVVFAPTPARIYIVGRGTCENANATIGDADGDGLTDGQEDVNGNGIADQGETDLNNPDTDDDGLFDGVERQNPANLDDGRNTNPLDRDSDDDTRPDGVEDVNRNGRVDEGERNPRVKD